MFKNIKNPFNLNLLKKKLGAESILNDNKILIVSIQKCGTHLIQNVLSKIGFEGVGFGKNCELADLRKLRQSQYMWTHYPPADSVLSAIEGGDFSIRIILNYRDPRDAVVSWFYWLHPNNTKITHFCREYVKKTYTSFSDEQLLEMFIKNEKFRPCEYNVLEYFKLSRALLFHPQILKIRYEDLIGESGGGEKSLQEKSIQNLFEFIGLDTECMDISKIAGSAFDKKSETFRKGVIGDFNSVFTKRTMDLFNENYADVLIQYGYEVRELK